MSQPFSLPDLPFDENALAPTISAQTVGLHYGKHHAAYFNMLNTLSEGTDFADMELENVVKGSFGNAEHKRFSTTQVKHGTIFFIGTRCNLVDLMNRQDDWPP